ncbi:RHS repeat-associated core domain-containing protein [Actinokineospora xionganensis]|uniref:Type IV secretion protein Rhs n=1 Tax=Actinokineospora xionganensis TaxID=2684470 RepID=A0ABR7LGC5_9PSEU|nr:RHS repeat-associated core domain-containing protein [Actinokineospora xionganensis]MBC6451700.1 type IV secretion protein Rhs [Actinokineospora xionganensis]
MTTVVAALAVAATAVTAVSPPAVAADEGPAVQQERSVNGGPVAIEPLPPMDFSTQQAAAASWPAEGEAQTEVVVQSAGRADTGLKQVGQLPVHVGLTDKRKPRTAKVNVKTFDQAVTRKAGVAGVLMRVTDAGGAKDDKVTVRLDYAKFAGGYGGDFGSRLRLAAFPECVLSTPEKAECQRSTPLDTANDTKSQQLTADVTLAGSTAVVAATSGTSGSNGSYGATNLAPSGSWSAGTSSGDFTYSIPLTVPMAPGGAAPQLGLSYASSNVDGRTSVTNNQASWVGDGWDLSAGGFIERTYRACAEDDGGNQGTTKTGDMCWKEEHYTVSLGGMSGKLIKDSVTGKLRPEKDDGSRIEKIGGSPNGYDASEQWKVTSPDGTQYFLGLNKLPGWAAGKPETNSTFTMPVFGNHAGEPCHQAASYANSSCTQPYRWNVDLMVDPRGNAMSFYYAHEINHYKRGGVNGTNTAYVAAGRLDRIEYGLRSDNLYAGAPAKVVFETAERCLPSGTITCDPSQLNADTASHWPDVPFDRICNAGEDCTGRFSPAFFSRKRLTKVVTYSGTEAVDSWTMRQQFPAVETSKPGPLWLSGVTRSGHVGGTASLPEVQFSGLLLDNRVDAIDGYPPLSRYRLNRIVGEAGALTQVTYAPHDCDRATRMPANPESNTYRCYPVWWTPPTESEAILDWFHKYVVEHVTEDSRTGGPSQQQTHYEYLGGGGWHYDDNDEAEANERTWSEWRGFGKVKVIRGAAGTPQTVSEALYLRGMDGDTLPNGGTRDVWVTDGAGGKVEDERRLRGFTRETLLHSGGAVVAASVSEPHLIETANDGKDPAFILRTKSTTTRTRQEDGNWRYTKTNTTFTPIGLPERVEDEGDTKVSGDESCAVTTYVQNEALWLLTYASTIRKIAKPCAAFPGVDADVLSDVRTSYDGQAFGAAPTRGEPSASQRWMGGGNYQTVNSAKYDAYGRVVESTDVDGVKSTTTYTPATGNPTTVSTTNRAGWVTTTTVDPKRGHPVTEVGINGERAELEYDALGRLTKVWLPGQAKDTLPNTTYAYDYRTDGPSVVTTHSLKENGKYAVSYDLLDGLLRQRQSQTSGLNGGRVLTDTFYDSRGNPFRVNGAYYNLDPPTPVLHGAYDNEVPNQTVTEYDDLGRPLETILKKLDIEQWRSKFRYGGDNTYTTPPQGDTATAVLKDAHGRIVERRQYHARSATGVYGADATYDATKYAYTTKGHLAKVSDPEGNEWTYEYDHLGRRAAGNDPDHGRTTYAYDDQDQLTSTTDANGDKLSYTYDALGRKTAMFDKTGAKLSEWVFDTLRKGMPTSSTRFQNGNAYTQKVNHYDSVGRATSMSVVIPAAEGPLAGTYTFGTSYSAYNSLVLRETVPAVGGLQAENIVHTYNDMDQPLSTYGSSDYASEHMYSPYGETLRVTLGASPNKVWLNSSYTEGTRRLDNIQVKRNTTTQPQVTNRSFGYDPAGNITKIGDTPTDGTADTQCFQYDYQRRMTSAWTPSSGDCAAAKSVAALGGAAPYWQDFTFDKIGNRKSMVSRSSAGTTTENYTNPASGVGAVRPHTLTKVNRSTPNSTQLDEYGYDAAGNTISRNLNGSLQKLDWNAEGRVSKVTEASGQSSTYLYDASGARLIKKEPGRNTLFLPGHELIQNTGSNPSIEGRRYYTHGGSTVAVRGTVSGLQWMLGDHHGTDDTAITASNLYVTRRHSDPFGNSRGLAPRYWPTNEGFVGGTKDTSGLTSVGAREYDPRTGRFISVDPIMDLAEPQQIHGYAYAHNAPATFWDPSGLAECADVNCNHTVSDYDPWTEQDQADLQSDPSYSKEYQDNVAKLDKESKAQACAGLRMSESECAQMMQDAQSKKGFWDVMKAELPDLLGDLTGFNDLRDCFTKFDLLACASLIPAAKLLKLIGAANKVFKAVKMALKWEHRVSAAIEKLGKWRAAYSALMRKGMDKLKSLLKKCQKHSFPPGTLVLMADGSRKPIEEVDVGDEVVATDPETGESSGRKVTATWTHNDEPERTELTVDVDGPAGTATTTISATDWHPFWVADLSDWVPVADVAVGSWLRTSSGTWVQVTAKRHFAGTGVVHDLTVDGIHSYHVGAAAVSLLVHNCDGPTLELKYKASWTDAQRAAADAKVAALNGTTMVVTKVKRDPKSAADRFKAAGNEIPDGADVDHKQDLQLGGADEVSNMWPLDLSVNRSLGPQIAQQIKKKKLKLGDVVCSISISDRC